MKHLMIILIRIYQKFPTHMHSACRFVPTCSNYAIEAYDRFGFFYGSYLTLKRLLKCAPLGSFGYDPVPIRRNKK